ncbi:hypothetical protein BsWGS_18741 [Bradybaena similaris]
MQNARNGVVHTMKIVEKETDNAVETIGKGTENTGKTIEKGTSDTWKIIEKGTVNTGKTIEKGTSDTVKTIQEGTINTWNTVEKGAVNTGKTIAKGTVNTGKIIAKGTVNTGKIIEKGTVNTWNTIEKGTSDIVNTIENAVRANSSCSCVNYTCGCCLQLIVEKISLNETGCLNISYLPDEYGFELLFTLNGKPIIDEKISVKNPPPICASIPYIHQLASLCIRFYNLDYKAKQFSGCADIEIVVEGVPVEKYDLGCFHIPPGHGRLLPKILSL